MATNTAVTTIEIAKAIQGASKDEIEQLISQIRGMKTCNYSNEDFDRRQGLSGTLSDMVKASKSKRYPSPCAHHYQGRAA